MASGVYIIIFNNGDKYVGKSIDIEKRFFQHAEAFRKGTAAKNMQYAFDNYGIQEAFISLECHPDHIDLMETCILKQVRDMGTPTLNAAATVEMSDEDIRDITTMGGRYIKLSTTEHIRQLVDKSETIDDLTTEIQQYKDEGIVIPKKLDKELKQLKGLNEKLESINYDLRREADKYQKLYKDFLALPWYRRIFL